MTQKELLYMEDAIGHETNLSDILTCMIEDLSDKDLKIFMKNQLKKHQNLKQKLLDVLEDATNEW